jgi:hypothetical protein
LESFPQFAAYQYLTSRGIVTAQEAIQNEKRRYQTARERLGKKEVPLVRLETANELAYNKGPLVLLSLDEPGSYSLMNRLGFLLKTYSQYDGRNVDPEQFVAALIQQLPEERKQTARALLYDTDINSETPDALTLRR